MPPVPGTFDGSRIRDLRLLLCEKIQQHYQNNGEWDRITKCRFYEYVERVTVKIDGGSRTDKWQQQRGIGQLQWTWRIVDTDFIWTRLARR